ncbi:D-2-hydroxyacid dehydrogenase [Rufibacter roseus]|uniref:D-2-hydroxyacid dehydrogenase n=1 Tax=Rufibacter roseus TaxID=1567108 RepID=A0ABW2DRF7_9BACT|nr:D-2-hydroxyacid dehydrogenase [Rufibacter roseus]
MKLFVYSDLSTDQKNYLRQQLPDGIEAYFSTDLSSEEQQQAFKEAEVIFGNPPAQWFSNPPTALRFWQLESAGFEQYRSVTTAAVVANMGDFFAIACAETMVAGILAMYRAIPRLVKLQDKKEWQGKEVRATLQLLSGKRVVILGAGTIAQAIKRMLTGFGCHIVLTARQNPSADILSKEELYRQLPLTDVVINTLPGHLVQYVSGEFLSKMKPGSLYANVGRGSTTNETALVSALQDGQLSGAVLDVTEQEPLPATSPLWQMNNVLLTQHTSGGQARETEGKINRFLENLQLFLAGEEVKDKLADISRGY